VVGEGEQKREGEEGLMAVVEVVMVAVAEGDDQVVGEEVVHVAVVVDMGDVDGVMSECDCVTEEYGLEVQQVKEFDGVVE